MRYSEALAKAEHSVGTTEYPHPPFPTNHTDFAPAVDAVWPLGFSRQNGQWCGTWIEWLLGQDILAGSVYTVPTGLSIYKQKGMFTVNPAPGYLCFQTYRADRLASHIGWVKAVVNATTVDNIEGNTSAGVSGVQDNGGGVYHRTRTGSPILGYGIVLYQPEGTEVPYKLLKSAAYANVFAFYASGLVRGLYGLKEFNEMIAIGVPLDDTASKVDIERTSLLAGPGSGPLVAA